MQGKGVERAEREPLPVFRRTFGGNAKQLPVSMHASATFPIYHYANHVLACTDFATYHSTPTHYSNLTSTVLSDWGLFSMFFPSFHFIPTFLGMSKSVHFGFSKFLILSLLSSVLQH